MSCTFNLVDRLKHWHIEWLLSLLFPNSHAMPKERKYRIFTGTCAACVFRPIFFYSLIRNLSQREENIVFSQVNVLHVSFVPFFSIP